MRNRARQTLAAPGIVSFDARSSATCRASAALATHGQDMSTRQTPAPAQGGDNSKVKTVRKYNPSDDEGPSNTAKGLGPAALAVLDHGVGKNGGGKMRQTAHVAGGARIPVGLGGSLPDNKTKAPHKGLLDAEAWPNGAAPSVFEGLSGV